MSEHKVTVEGGSSVRLLTAGKYCDKDIVVEATGGGGSGNSPGDSWIENGGTTYTNDKAVKIGGYVFQGNTVLTSVSFPNVLSVGVNAFNNCKVLAAVDLPKATSLANSAFYQSSKIADFYAPKVKTLGSNALRGNLLKEAIFLELTTLGTYAFTSCTKLAYADVGLASTLGTYTFNGCSALKTLVLRRESVASLGHATNVLAGTPIAAGTGYVYVPDELVERYKVATNWVNYAAQIKPLSELEG